MSEHTQAMIACAALAGTHGAGWLTYGLWTKRHHGDPADVKMAWFLAAVSAVLVWRFAVMA